MHEDLHKFLKSRGLKLTPQRSQILKTFLAVRGHVSAEELYTRLKRKDPSIGQATVFRFMKLLAEAKIAQTTGLGERKLRYEPRRSHHGHMVCTECGAVAEFSNDTLERQQERIASRLGFLLKEQRMELFGLCSKCKAKSPQEVLA